MEKKLKAALYARVSTSDQHNENQLLELRRFCQNNDYEIIGEFADVISGVKDTRPQLDKLMQAARQKEFDCVICYKFDRMGRSTRHLLQILEELRNKGIRIIATSQNIDTESSAGKLFFTIIAGFAEMEREMMIERVNLSVKRAKSQGKIWGRPKGAKDKNHNGRRRLGYLARWEKERLQNGKVAV